MRNAFWLLMALSPGISASPAPIVTFKIQHYEVAGQTVAEIKSSMFRNTPVRGLSGNFGAVTVNSFSTTYNLMPTASGGCEVRNPVVALDSVVTLPRLVIGNQTRVVLVEWQRFIGALRAHEMLHAKNGLNIAQTILTRLSTIQTRMPCNQVSVNLNNAIQVLMNNMSEFDRQLDSKTNHGESQGAVLNTNVR